MPGSATKHAYALGLRGRPRPAVAFPSTVSGGRKRSTTVTPSAFANLKSDRKGTGAACPPSGRGSSLCLLPGPPPSAWSAPTGGLEEVLHFDADRACDPVHRAEREVLHSALDPLVVRHSRTDRFRYLCLRFQRLSAQLCHPATYSFDELVNVVLGLHGLRFRTLALTQKPSYMILLGGRLMRVHGNKFWDTPKLAIWLTVLPLAGCTDRAKADYDQCLEFERKGNYVTAFGYCKAATQADSNSESGKAAAAKVPELEAKKKEAEKSASASAAAKASAAAQKLAELKVKLHRESAGSGEDDNCMGRGLPPRAIRFGGGTFEEIATVAESMGCRSPYPQSSVVRTWCCP
jgi:hypothetical protein